MFLFLLLSYLVANYRIKIGLSQIFGKKKPRVLNTDKMSDTGGLVVRKVCSR